MPAKHCTARIAWGAFGPAAEPPAGPMHHRCTHDRGHRGKHRATWQGRAYEWAPMAPGARVAGRPRKDAAEARSVRVVVLVTQGEMVALGARAGGPVGPWLREVGLRQRRRPGNPRLVRAARRGETTMTIRVQVSTEKVGSDCVMEIEVDDDATREQIEEEARDAMHGMIEWRWERVGEARTTTEPDRGLARAARREK